MWPTYLEMNSPTSESNLNYLGRMLGILTQYYFYFYHEKNNAH